MASRLDHATWMELIRDGLVTIAALERAYDSGDLRSVKGIGPKRFQEVGKALEAHTAKADRPQRGTRIVRSGGEAG